MKYINLTFTRFFVWVIASVVLVSCQSNELGTTSIEDEPATTETATVRFSVAEGKGIHSGIKNLVLCGSSIDGTIENEGDVLNNKGVFNIAKYEGTKSFFFVANLNDADRARVKATDPSKFNDIVLDIWDYISGKSDEEPTTENYPTMPMVCMLKDVKWEDLVNASEPWQLTRLFAVIHYKIVFPTPTTSAFYFDELRIVNYPSSFALADPISSYDLSPIYYAENIYMGTYAPTEGKIFVPEHYVSNPSFYDADDHGMTYLLISYRRIDASGLTKQHTIGVRIGEYNAQNYHNYGQIVRGRVYNAVINIPDENIPSAYNTLHFLN